MRKISDDELREIETTDQHILKATVRQMARELLLSRTIIAIAGDWNAFDEWDDETDGRVAYDEWQTLVKGRA